MASGGLYALLTSQFTVLISSLSALEYSEPSLEGYAEIINKSLLHKKYVVGLLSDNIRV